MGNHGKQYHNGVIIRQVKNGYIVQPQDFMRNDGGTYDQWLVFETMAALQAHIQDHFED